MILSGSRKIYQAVINGALIAVTLWMILPMILLFMSSITEENSLITNGYSFFPGKLSLASYLYITTNASSVFKAYGITIFVTVLGTASSLLLTSLVAFPLSLRDLPARRIISFYIFFTMLFNGGLVPSYIMWTTVFHIKNTIWAYIFPNFLLSAFNVILVRTYFQANIPVDIYNAAEIDGRTI
jgi:putative aldouronate transport system permease protein